MKNRILAAWAALRGRPVMYRMNAHGDFRLEASVGYFGRAFMAENWLPNRRGRATEPAPIVTLAQSYKGGDPVNDLAILLMVEWGSVDPRSSVAQHPASYVANFADMARAVLKSREPRSSD